MARKKRHPPAPAGALPPTGSPGAAASTPAPVAGAAQAADGLGTPESARPRPSLPPEAGGKDGTAWWLALMMAVTPAIGSPTEMMLQDTLKSMVVAGFALGAALWFLWRRLAESPPQPLRWHGTLALPLLLMAYALGSMAWSHTYLAGVEAIRWFLFTLIAGLALNAVSAGRFATVAHGIHHGALIASVWTALQFWFDMRLFPQGPNPASTFVNRNFFAEFVVCTVPFSAYLLARARGTGRLAWLAFGTGFNIVAMLMTGTRSALVALGLLLLCLPFVAWRHRRAWAWAGWSRAERATAVGALALTVGVLGLLPTGNAELMRQIGEHGATPLSRTFSRGSSIADRREYTERSMSMRLTMWRTTGRMIAAHPWIGVGAGAWEVQSPRFQERDTVLETDFYVHNEILQLLAEYGLVGAFVLLAWLAWLAGMAWRTLREPDEGGAEEGALRATLLCAMLAFLAISNAGFPWRMASTAALFALMVGALAASEARLGRLGALDALAWTPSRLALRLALGTATACAALAVFISVRAAQAEANLVQSVRYALATSQAGRPSAPEWRQRREKMLEMVRAGMAINPHYRKITPMVADEMARWGDWRHAVEIWESVVASRPYVVALHTNIARGYAQLGDLPRAVEALERARQIQPNAPSVVALDLLMQAQSGQVNEAVERARRILQTPPRPDVEVLNAAYVLGMRSRDWQLALSALEMRVDAMPEQASETLIRMGRMYADPPLSAPDRAAAAFRRALAAAPPERRDQVLRLIPPAVQAEAARQP